MNSTPTCSKIALFVDQCFDTFRPSILAIFRKLSLAFAAYFSTYMLEIPRMIDIIVAMIKYYNT